MTGNAHKRPIFLHNHTPNVQGEVTFSSKSLRNSKKMCYFAPRKRKNRLFFKIANTLLTF